MANELSGQTSASNHNTIYSIIPKTPSKQPRVPDSYIHRGRSRRRHRGSLCIHLQTETHGRHGHDRNDQPSTKPAAGTSYRSTWPTRIVQRQSLFFSHFSVSLETTG